MVNFFNLISQKLQFLSFTAWVGIFLAGSVFAQEKTGQKTTHSRTAIGVYSPFQQLSDQFTHFYLSQHEDPHEALSEDINSKIPSFWVNMKDLLSSLPENSPEAQALAYPASLGFRVKVTPRLKFRFGRVGVHEVREPNRGIFLKVPTHDVHVHIDAEFFLGDEKVKVNSPIVVNAAVPKMDLEGRIEFEEQGVIVRQIDSLRFRFDGNLKGKIQKFPSRFEIPGSQIRIRFKEATHQAIQKELGEQLVEKIGVKVEDSLNSPQFRNLHLAKLETEIKDQVNQSIQEFSYRIAPGWTTQNSRYLQKKYSSLFDEEFSRLLSATKVRKDQKKIDEKEILALLGKANQSRAQDPKISIHRSYLRVLNSALLSWLWKVAKDNYPETSDLSLAKSILPSGVDQKTIDRFLDLMKMAKISRTKNSFLGFISQEEYQDHLDSFGWALAFFKDSIEQGKVKVSHEDRSVYDLLSYLYQHPHEYVLHLTLSPKSQLQSNFLAVDFSGVFPLLGAPQYCFPLEKKDLNLPVKAWASSQNGRNQLIEVYHSELGALAGDVLRADAISEIAGKDSELLVGEKYRSPLILGDPRSGKIFISGLIHHKKENRKFRLTFEYQPKLNPFNKTITLKFIELRKAKEEDYDFGKTLLNPIGRILPDLALAFDTRGIIQGQLPKDLDYSFDVGFLDQVGSYVSGLRVTHYSLQLEVGTRIPDPLKRGKK